MENIKFNNKKILEMSGKEKKEILLKILEMIIENFECIGIDYNKNEFEHVIDKIKNNGKNRKMMLLFSHLLDEIQKKDAEKNMNVNEIIKLDEKNQIIWSNINPLEETQEKNKNIDKIKSFVREKIEKNDYILIQGEWGYVFDMVNWAKQNGFIPIYSATNREYEEIENQDGSKKIIHTFKHIKYKSYFDEDIIYENNKYKFEINIEKYSYNELVKSAIIILEDFIEKYIKDEDEKRKYEIVKKQMQL